jgi:hypothetical protein
VIVVIGFYVVQLAWGIGLKFAVVMTASFIVTMVIYELLVRRWNPVRVLFGMHRKR